MSLQNLFLSFVFGFAAFLSLFAPKISPDQFRWWMIPFGIFFGLLSFLFLRGAWVRYNYERKSESRLWVARARNELPENRLTLNVRDAYNLTNRHNGKSLADQHHWNYWNGHGDAILPTDGFDSYDEYLTALELSRPEYRERAAKNNITIRFSERSVRSLWKRQN